MHGIVKTSNNNTYYINFKSECPFRYKISIIDNLISCGKLISSSKIIFYIELKNIEEALINNWLPNSIVGGQIKRAI